MHSTISTDTPGRVDKTNVLHALEQNGESYDRARETLKQVSVDASGKVELEDWVEVFYPMTTVLRIDLEMPILISPAQRQATEPGPAGSSY